MDLKEIGCEVVDRIHLAQERVQWWALVNTVMSLYHNSVELMLCYIEIIKFSFHNFII
jgi:hypothetical protein